MTAHREHEAPPLHLPHDNGTDQDLDRRSARSLRRAANSEVTVAGRRALVVQLNDTGSGIAEMATFLRVKRPGLEQLTATHIPRVAIYLRVSTEEQARVGGQAEGFSIPYQRDACLTKVRDLGGILAGEYVDAGESAKSADRPELQRMLKDLKAKRIDYVLVHKIDRLARNRADDVAINTAIAAAGAKLISVAEPVDETPAGKLLYNMMAGVAQYHSDNLAVEVLKGMVTKAKMGGTPYRAPLGYLNHQEIHDGIVVRSIVLDPERAPLIRWAFEQYALGIWSLSRLVDALNSQGLTSRPTPKRPAKPISLNGIHFLMRNPYYIGVVPYRGVFHEGKHEPLVSVELWLRVQDVLTAHRVSGDKQFKYEHYLKGSIFCGQCGARLVYSRNRGRGGVYEYFDCLSKKTKRRPCTQRAVRLHKVEAGVERLYEHFHLSAARATQIRDAVLTELAADRDEADREVQRALKRLRAATDQQAKLLQAHYAGAVPLELMKAEMERLTSEKAQAERSIASAKSSVADLETTLNAALKIATECHTYYHEAEPAIRRRLNQGFFKKLYIHEDGQVDRFELTEPFATLLDRSLPGVLANQRQSRLAGDLAEHQEHRLDTEITAEDRTSPSAVLAKTFTCVSKTDQPDGGAIRLGLNIHDVVLGEGVEPPKT
ncbi:MAG TPA: recombinase family protein [Magnetospirillaceae bacterium]|nr:recombinase family protein [Magnetospirillaceae bacterium]